MIINILLIIIGIVVVLYGADRMTEGAVGLAKRMQISEIVIGLTVVAIGTSAPELFISLVAAIKGTPDMAVGNVVGSNIFNTLLIAGAAAAVAPIAISRITARRDLPIAAATTLLLTIICSDKNISRIDALLLFIAFIVFIYMTVKSAKNDSPSTTQHVSLGKSILLIIVGLALLIVGSRVFVENATQLAAALGVSEAVIGLTIVAGGTSLPELATSVVAARKGQSAIAIGNVLGSNIFNILLILGLTGIVKPMAISGITIVDFAVMFVSIILLWAFSYTKLKVERWEGFLLLAMFAAYMTWLLV